MIRVIGKMLVDIALYQMYAALVLGYIWRAEPSVWGMVCAVLAVVVAALPERIPALRKKKGKYGAAVGVVVVFACGYFTGMDLAQTIAYTPVLAYLLMMSITHAWYYAYDEQKTYFGKGFLGLLVIPVLCLFGITKVKNALVTTVPWILFYMIIGFMQLRLLREQNNGVTDKKGFYRQLAEIGALCLSCFLVEITGLFQLLVDSLQAFWKDAILPIFRLLFAWLLYGLIWLIEVVVKFLMSFGSENYGDIEVENTAKGLAEEMALHAEEWQPFSDATVIVWAIIFSVLGIVVIGFFLRKMLGNRNPEENADGVTERREYLNHSAGGTKRFFVPRDSKAAVRYYFGRYRSLLQKKGAYPMASDTSRELVEKGNAAFTGKGKCLEALRALYLPARYDEGAQVSREDRRQAAKLWQEISREK